MPRYSYRCNQCGAPEIEVTHKMGAKMQVRCSQCGAIMVKLPPRKVIGTRNANVTLLNEMNDKFDNYRYRRKKGHTR